MSATLEFRSSVITGFLAGKPLHCQVHSPLPGSMPAAGLYYIQPPVHDVIYGLVAVMVPVGQVATSGGVTAKVELPGSVANKQFSPLGGVSAKVESPMSGKFSPLGGVANKKFSPPGSVAAKISDPFWGVTAKAMMPTQGATPSFVLSAQAVPGRRCLVIDHSFADLMDALFASGGASIRIA